MTIDITIGSHTSPPWYVAMAPLFSLGSTAILGVIAAYIGWRQWRTAHTKLRLDLYDRRLAVYEACRKMIADVAFKRAVTAEQYYEYFQSIGGTAFIFDGYVELYVRMIADCAAGMIRANDARPEYEFWRHQAIGWMSGRLLDVERVFRPYLVIERPLVDLYLMRRLRPPLPQPPPRWKDEM